VIVVTGGAGYVGSVLVHELLAQGESVRVIDTHWYGREPASHARLESVAADLRSPNASWLDGVTTVIHLGGLSNDPTADFAPDLNSEINVRATRQLALECAKAAHARGSEIRFLFASTCSVYYSPARAGDLNVEPMDEEVPIAPTANYSKSKRLAEIELLRIADSEPLFCPVILRKATLYGRSERMRFDLVVNTFTLHAWRNRLIQVHGHGEVWRPLLDVRDAVDAYVHLLSAPTEKVRGEVFNVVHKNYRILELAHWVAEVLEQQRGVDVRVKRDRSVDNSARSYYVVADKIARVLGFRAERGTSDAALAIWDALERGEYGLEPEGDSRFFNIRWLKEATLSGVGA
jgi:nucleoside-diphosphate-sugar epimerase